MPLKRGIWVGPSSDWVEVSWGRMNCLTSSDLIIILLRPHHADALGTLSFVADLVVCQVGKKVLLS